MTIAGRMRRRPFVGAGILGPMLGLLLLGPLHGVALVAATIPKIPSCPGSPLILTEPDSMALDTMLSVWVFYGRGACDGHIVLAAPGIYRISSEVRATGRSRALGTGECHGLTPPLSLSQDAHLVQGNGSRVWEATVPGVELRPRYEFSVFGAHLVLRGLTLSVSK